VFSVCRFPVFYVFLFVRLALRRLKVMEYLDSFRHESGLCGVRSVLLSFVVLYTKGYQYIAMFVPILFLIPIILYCLAQVQTSVEID
jgi:hypothetical protein